jgi:transposase InsO family protein
MYTLEQKLHILNHSLKHGIPSATDAFSVSPSSIYAWRIELVENHNNPTILINKSTKRHNPNQRNWDRRIEEFIQQTRITHIGLSKEKVHVLLKPECEKWKLVCPCVSTVGRIIKGMKKNHQIPNHKPSISFYANTGEFRLKQDRKKTKKKRPEKREWKQPGERLQIDTVIIFIQGVKRYIISIKDAYSRMSFSYAYKSLSSTTSTDFIKKARQALPYIDSTSEIQTDNGSEFMKYFKEYLEQEEIMQVWNYPRHPKMNAYIERYNRTIQEEFVIKYLDILKSDITHFNELLMDWLIWYNTKRPHFGLDLKSPIQYILETNQFSKMWWTGTTP